MLSSPGKPILIIGASARAAADSAIRRGRLPMALDLFGDLDLLEAARGRHIRIPAAGYPGSIPELARRLPAAPFIYTGGLENHPRIIAALESERAGEGCASGILGQLRDPFRMAALFERRGIAAPKVSAGGGALKKSGAAAAGWLRKPLDGCGGRGIARHAPGRPVPPGWFLQEEISGEPIAAIYEGNGAGKAAFLGATRQWVGEPQFGARPFAYCGSIGPLELPRGLRSALVRIGEALAEETRFRGFLGVDALLHGGVPIPIEINPRYTASIEILELAARSGGIHGKVILFAREPAAVDLDLRLGDLPCRVADVPAPGTRLPRGRPMLTALASARTAGACRRALLDAAAALYRLLRAPEAAAQGSGRCP